MSTSDGATRKKVKGRLPGVRYREHASRLLPGVGKRKDRFYFIRYKLDGKDREEPVGWHSEGFTEEMAFERLAEIKRNRREGQGPQSLKEKRAASKAKRREEDAKRAQEAIEALTFGDFYASHYLPQAEMDKARSSCKAEASLYRTWISPALGKLPLRRIAPLDLERMKKDMLDAGRSPRSIEYALALVRQVFNVARKLGFYDGDSPTLKVGKPKKDNRRLRFLTPEEADKLLEALALRSLDVRDIALLSLHCGLRFGEIAALEWGDVDQGRGLLTLRDTKAGRNRVAYMTQAVRDIFSGRTAGRHHALVFPAKELKPGKDGKAAEVNKRMSAISKTFDKTVQALGLNNGIEDPRQKVVFHSLRHTFASWLVERGTDLYAVKTLLGHSTLAMTERYSHLGADTLREASRLIEQAPQPKAGKVVNLKRE